MTRKLKNDLTDDRLEAIAKDIESLQATAILHVAERLAEAHEIFRYRRDEGGFAGWVETRLRFSRHTAYNLLHVHEQFGGKESVENLDTFSASVLYLLAAPSTPAEARDAVLDRAAKGEKPRVADIKHVIAKAKQRAHKPPTKTPSEKSKQGAIASEKQFTAAIGKIKAQQQQNVSPASAGERARKDARLAELENTTRLQELKITALESEIEDLKKSAATPRAAGPRPPANEMLLKLSALIAGGGEIMERFIRRLLIAGAKAVAEGDDDIEQARRVLAKFEPPCRDDGLDIPTILRRAPR